MNPWYGAMLKSLARAALLFLSGWLAEHNVWSKAEGDTYVDHILPYVVPAFIAAATWIWGHRAELRARVTMLTALHWADATENDVKAHIAIGGPTPAVSTPADSVPVPKPAA